MATLLHEDSNFTILRGFDYIVVRKNSPYEFHSHFKRYSGALGLIRLFDKKVQPQDEYFNTAMKRITTEAEFESFGHSNKKPQYHNSTKGRRR